MTTLIVAFNDFAKALLRMFLTMFKSFALFSPSKASSPPKTALINLSVMKVQFFQIQTTLTQTAVIIGLNEVHHEKRAILPKTLL